MVDSSTINIPDLGEVEEAEVIEICVEVGQSVESEDPIMVLETDKAAMEIPASVDGIIKALKVSVGDMAKTGMPFVDIEVMQQEQPTEEVSVNNKEIIDSNKTENLKVISEVVNLISPNIPDRGEVVEAEVIEICVEVGQSVESEDPIISL